MLIAPIRIARQTLDNIDISTLSKGKIPASTNDVEIYNKETFEEEIYKFIQTNMQLV